MLFNSLIFILFALLFFSSFWLIKKKKIQFVWMYIVFFSFVFYGWWDWRFLFLILTSGFIDFFAGQGIYKYPKFKKLFLIVSITGNIGTLVVFKYSKFILGQIESLVANFNIEANLTQNYPEFLYILPVGISFYTFQSMSYTIDIYRNELKPTKSVLKFFAYLSMFPQLVAGPIIRSKTLMPQLDRPRKTTEQERWNGLKLITYGFFKKILIADNLAPFVNTGFADINQTTSSLYWWGIMLGFAFQIYCDFSGYTDIARGIAKWMGFHFRINFNHPYKAGSMRDFWQRWHISLSTWFRDYVYIPLGGSKKGKLRSHINMWITMFVSGFWHGASWNFVIWGGLHAFYSSLERITSWPIWLKRSGARWLAIVLVMFQTTLAWVFFRATSFNDALIILKNMLSFNTNIEFAVSDDLRNGFYFILIILIIEYVFVSIRLNKIVRNNDVRKKLEIVLIGLLIAITIFLRGKGHEFIYFQF